MNLQRAISKLHINPEVELFAISIDHNTVQFIELIAEDRGDTVEIAACWDNVKLFDETDYDNQEDTILRDLDECENDLKSTVFIDKEDVGYFSVASGQEGQYLLSFIFPDLPDAFEITTAEEKSDFIALVAKKIETLNAQHAKD